MRSKLSWLVLLAGACETSSTGGSSANDAAGAGAGTLADAADTSTPTDASTDPPADGEADAGSDGACAPRTGQRFCEAQQDAGVYWFCDDFDNVTTPGNWTVATGDAPVTICSDDSRPTALALHAKMGTSAITEKVVHGLITPIEYAFDARIDELTINGTGEPVAFASLQFDDGSDTYAIRTYLEARKSTVAGSVEVFAMQGSTEIGSLGSVALGAWEHYEIYNLTDNGGTVVAKRGGIAVQTSSQFTNYIAVSVQVRALGDSEATIAFDDVLLRNR